MADECRQHFAYAFGRNALYTKLCKEEYTDLPEYILIDTLPTKLEYYDGENIDITGMVVKAYRADDTLWDVAGYPGGIIPNEELEISPAIASGEIYILNGIKAKPFYCGTECAETGKYTYQHPYIRKTYHYPTYDLVLYGCMTRSPQGDFVITRYGDNYYIAILDGGTSGYGYITENADGSGWYGWSPFCSTSVTNMFQRLNTSPPPYEGSSAQVLLENVPYSEVDPSGVDFSNAQMLQTITVTWHRPKDNVPLSDTFEITVTNQQIYTDDDGVYAQLIDTVTQSVHGGGWAWNLGWYDLPIYDGVMFSSTDYPGSNLKRTIGSNIETSFLATVYGGKLYLKKTGDGNLTNIVALGYNEEHSAWESWEEWDNVVDLGNFIDVGVLYSNITNTEIPVSTKDPTQAGEMHPV